MPDHGEKMVLGGKVKACHPHTTKRRRSRRRAIGNRKMLVGAGSRDADWHRAYDH
jgi:hypothetical protein